MDDLPFDQCEAAFATGVLQACALFARLLISTPMLSDSSRMRLLRRYKDIVRKCDRSREMD
jgi:hypothetical protein